MVGKLSGWQLAWLGKSLLATSLVGKRYGWEIAGLAKVQLANVRLASSRLAKIRPSKNQTPILYHLDHLRVNNYEQGFPLVL